jgi:hypothetical protein
MAVAEEAAAGATGTATGGVTNPSCRTFDYSCMAAYI